MNINLAKLESVDIREVWKHEAKDFTQWLAMPDNLRFLGETIGLELEPIEPESKVGKYSADIFAKDVNTDHKVVIENQLEESDHDHLGKCITYASGKGADVVVWIVRKANEEHSKAVEWLNERTDSDLAFFLLEIEAWRIGNSNVAPKFNIVEQPNEWARAVKQTTNISDTNLLYQRFWTAFADYANKRSDFTKQFRTTKPQPQNWMAFASFATGCHLSLVTNSFYKRVLVKIYVSQHSPYLDAFVDRYGEIEKDVGLTFECGTAKDKTFSVVKDFDVEHSEANWEDAFKWFCDTLLKLKSAAIKLANSK